MKFDDAWIGMGPCRQKHSENSLLKWVRLSVDESIEGDLCGARIYEKRLLRKSTNIAEIEDVLRRMYRVQNIVQELFYNGSLRGIDEFTFNEEQVVVDDIADLLGRINA